MHTKNSTNHKQPSNGTSLRAGVGKVDITATAGERSYALYPKQAMAHIPPQYREQRVEIADPLYVRALVLDDGIKQTVIVTLDCCAIAARTTSQFILYDNPDDFMPRLRLRVENELGISGDNISVSASHTHPPGRLLCDEEEQISRTLAAIRQARDSLTPVTIGTGSGHETTLTMNRTLMMKDGTDYSWTPEAPGDEIERQRPIDPEIGIVRIDRFDGTPLAVLYNFASHLLVGCRQGKITADFPGVTSRYIETTLGGDVTAIFLQGANGDIFEAAYYDRNNPRTKEDFGYRLGRSLLTAYRTIETRPVEVRVSTRHVSLPLRRDIPDRVAAIRRQQAERVASLRYVKLNFKTFLPLYLNHKLHPNFPGHTPQRYLAADTCGDETFRMVDVRNENDIKQYLNGMRVMEWLAIEEHLIGTLAKHQEIIETLGGEQVPAEIKGIRIGESVFVAAPIEMVAEIGFRVKRLSPFRQTWVISNSNGYLHYAAPADYYPRGGYEVTECLLAPEWEAVFMETVRQIFEELADSSSLFTKGKLN